MNPKLNGEYLKATRKALGLSQATLAYRAGTTDGTIKRAEKGESIPRGDTLIRIAQILGVPVESLFITPDKEAVA
jgi:transcriptional regulator with XRE-family HTH domain